MTNYYIGYKQGNGEYVYVNAINDYSISVTVNEVNAIDFLNDEMAKNMCEYLNLRDTSKTYLPLMVTTNIEELLEEVGNNDAITSE